MTTAPYFLAKRHQYFRGPQKVSYHKADATILYLVTEILAEDFVTSKAVQLSEWESA